jgi:thiamine-phosphate pyrophosphorylase
MTKIYLISPPRIDLKNFSSRLNLALKTGLVPVFQARLKDYEISEVEKISRELKKICHENNCLFLLNDFSEVALNIGADGVHLGVEDGSIAKVRAKSPKSFLIGASCYDSRHLAMEAAEAGCDYLSFGAFFESKTKKSRGNPTTEILEWCDEVMNLPTVAIGGITADNCKTLVEAKADFLAVISYVWDHVEGEVTALKNLYEAIILSESDSKFVSRSRIL